MADFTQLGLYLKNKRIEADFTQAELSNKLGDMHSQFISNWERGLCAPPTHSFQKLIQVLRLDRARLTAVMLKDSKVIIEAKVYKTSARKFNRDV